MATVPINGTTYFIDERLHELRNVVDPTDLIRFETDGDMLVFLGQYAEWDSFIPSRYFL